MTNRFRASRRIFIAQTIATIAATSVLPGCVGTPSRRGTLLSGFEDARGDQYIGGLSLADGRVFGARIPVRAHGCALDPRDPQRAIFFARRPGTQAFVLDLASQRARLAFETTAGRHFAGHGVFSTDGTLLYTPEHDYERKRGVLGVRDARDFRLVGEIETQGLDPHDIAWLPGHGRLLVANGGILTHPRTFRRKLNIDTMDPSLCAIDAASGECLEQWRLGDHQLSIRHLSVASDGTAAVGLQYEGARSPKPSVVALYRPQRGLTLLEAPSEALASMAGYVASVCVSDAHDLVAASCPYGKGIVCWTRQGVFRGVVPAAEAYGLSRLADGSVYVSQRDGLAFELDETRLRSQFVKVVASEAIRWDDHWVATV